MLQWAYGGIASYEAKGIAAAAKEVNHIEFKIIQYVRTL